MVAVLDRPLQNGADVQIAHAVHALASVCDGAVEEDGRGFNGTDASFGRRLAELPAARWSAGNFAAAYKMLAKYRGQLAGFGIDYDAITPPPASWEQEATRSTWRKQDVCSVDIENEQFAVRFPYDPVMVEASRRIPGRRWDAAEKTNLFPLTSAAQLAVFIEQHGSEWEIVEQARVWLQGSKPAVVPEKPPIGSVDLEDRAFAVYVYEYSASMVDKLKSIPGRRWVPERRVNVIPERSAQALAVFLAEHEGYEVSEEVRRRMEELRSHAGERAATAKAMVELSKSADAELYVDGLGGELRPFQRAGVAYVEAADGRSFICDDMGTGKTVQALALIHKRQAYPAIVVAPASVKLSWRNHVQGPPRWTERHPIPREGWLPGKRVVALKGRKPSPELLEGADVIVLNWDILAAWEPLLSELGAKAVVFDESHYAKEVRAGRTKAALSLSKHTAKGALKLCMSGTSVVNRPKELIAQLRLIDRMGELFGTAREFRNRYCDSYWDGYRWNDAGASNLEELNRVLRENCFIRRTKAEVMSELPAKVPARVPVTLDNAKDYDRAEQETIKFLMEQVAKDREIAAELAELPPGERAQAMRERQQDKAESARRAEKIVRMNLLRKVCAEGKIKAAVAWVSEFLSDSDSKLIVFAHHISVQKALLAQFPDAARIFGEDSAQKRTDAIERFQTDPECRLIVCSLKAAREGITLTAASDVATIELDWTPATHDQAEDRSHRMGQTESVTCWYFTAEETIDDDMLELIEEKREVTSAVMDGEAKRREMTTSVMGALEQRLIAKGLRR